MVDRKPSSSAGAIRLLASVSDAGQILASVSEAIVAVGADDRVTFANPAAAELFNRDIAAMPGIALDRLFVLGDGAPAPVKAQLVSGPFHSDCEAWLQRTDGSTFEATYVIAPLTDGKVRVGAVITVRDVTEKKRLAAEQRLASAVFEHGLDGLVVTGSRKRVTKFNPAFRRLSGAGDDSIVGKSLAEALKIDSQRLDDAIGQLDRAPQIEWEQWYGAAANRKAWRIGLTAVRDDKRRLQQFVAAVSDITARKLQEEKMVFQATYDQLTELPNRTLFNDRLNQLVLEARRAKSNIGLMFIDLDGFKAINDNLGHDAGDLLLQGAAERLQKCVREADTVARLGGDEFTVIMPLLDSLDGATLVAGRILTSLTQPFDLAGKEGRVSASIGISMFPSQAGDVEGLLRNADVAMYHAKHQGKANYQIWRQELGADPVARG